eukprot:1159477-Pelagomonas_calceolata.AAC.8
MSKHTHIRSGAQAVGCCWAVPVGAEPQALLHWAEVVLVVSLRQLRGEQPTWRVCCQIWATWRVGFR